MLSPCQEHPQWPAPRVGSGGRLCRAACDARDNRRPCRRRPAIAVSRTLFEARIFSQNRRPRRAAREQVHRHENYKAWLRDGDCTEHALRTAGRCSSGRPSGLLRTGGRNRPEGGSSRAVASALCGALACRPGGTGAGRMNFAPASEQIKAAAAIQLSVAGVGKRFGGVTAVEDVSIDVPKGRIVSIIGPNGAGKTSLLNMISGFYRPDSGRITLDGRDITQQAPERDRGAGRSAHLPEHRPVRRPHRARQPHARPPRADALGRAAMRALLGPGAARGDPPPRGLRGDHRLPEAAGPAQAADCGACRTA